MALTEIANGIVKTIKAAGPLRRIAISIPAAVLVPLVIVPVLGLFVHSAIGTVIKAATLVVIPGFAVSATLLANSDDIIFYSVVVGLQVAYMFALLSVWHAWLNHNK